MSLTKSFVNLILGNPDKPDYSPEDMPHNRLELFKTVLSVRRHNLFPLSLLLSLSYLPALLWIGYTVIQLIAIVDFSPLKSPQALQAIAFPFLLILAPLIAITCPFRVACSYIVRNWARDEHADIQYDFKYALRSSWKQGLLFGLMTGFLLPAFYIVLYTYFEKAHVSAFYYFPITCVLIIFLIWRLCCQIIPVIIVTYKLSYYQIIKNSFILICTELPRSILIRISTLIIPILFTIIAILTKGKALTWLIPLYITYSAVFGLGLCMLIRASFSNMLCEKYLHLPVEN